MLGVGPRTPRTGVSPFNRDTDIFLRENHKRVVQVFNKILLEAKKAAPQDREQIIANMISKEYPVLDSKFIVEFRANFISDILRTCK